MLDLHTLDEAFTYSDSGSTVSVIPAHGLSTSVAPSGSLEQISSSLPAGSAGVGGGGGATSVAGWLAGATPLTSYASDFAARLAGVTPH